MKTQDRFTKATLLLLTGGVWSLSLRPFFNSSPVVAQTAKPATQYAMATITLKQLSAEENKKVFEDWGKAGGGKTLPVIPPGYEVDRSANLSTVQVKIGGNGRLSLSSSQVNESLSLAQKSGWKLHSIVPYDQGEFIVTFEK